MRSKVKAWFYGKLMLISLCISAEALVARHDPLPSVSSSLATRSTFIPFTNEQSQTLLVEPQLFLDGIGPQCGGIVLAIEVNGSSKTLRCSNRNAIHKKTRILDTLNRLFKRKRPISEREARILNRTGELARPSGVILFIVDRAMRSANIFVDGSGSLSDIFDTQEAFDAWIQEAIKGGYALGDVSSQSQGIDSGGANLVPTTLGVTDSIVYIPDKIAAVGNGFSGVAQILNRIASSTPALSHLGKLSGALELAGTHLGTIAGSAAKVLGPVGTALTIAQAVGLDEFAKNMPQLLYPAGDSEQSKFVIIHGKIVMALLGALAKEQGIESHLGDLARMSDCIHFYNVQRGLLSQEWRQNFKKHPKEAVEQLALESGQNVCCLVVSSGRFVCPNFFQTLYVCRQDPVSNQPISEVIKSRGLKDNRITDSFGEKCTLDELVQGKTRLFVIDQKANQIYLVSYEPQGTPQFPNIFTPENWNHWRKVFSSVGERLKGTGELLGISFGKKLRALPVVGNYAADKLGLKHELSSKKAIEDTLTTFTQAKTQSNALQLEEEQSLIGQPISAPKIELGMGEYSNDPMEMNDFSSDSFSNLSQDDVYSLKTKKLSEDSRKDWPKQVTYMEAVLYDHPYDGDEYIDEAPNFRFEDYYASGIPVTA